MHLILCMSNKPASSLMTKLNKFKSTQRGSVFNIIITMFEYNILIEIANKFIEWTKKINYYFAFNVWQVFTLININQK